MQLKVKVSKHYGHSVLCCAVLSLASWGCSSPEKKDTMEANKVTWFSIPADSLSRATQFYRSAFGWQIESLTKEKNEKFSFHVALNSKSDENYVSEMKGVLNGCIVNRSIGLPHPAILIEVPDLEEAIGKVLRAGGSIETGKIPMPSLQGSFVLVKDTEGNYVEIFQNSPAEK